MTEIVINQTKLQNVLEALPSEIRVEFIKRIAQRLGPFDDNDPVFDSINYILVFIDEARMLLEEKQEELSKGAIININEYIQKINKTVGESSNEIKKNIDKSLDGINSAVDSIQDKIEGLHSVAENKIERIYKAIDEDIEKIQKKVSESNKSLDGLLSNVKGLSDEISTKTGEVVSKNLKDTIDRRSKDFVDKADDFDEKVTKSIDTFTKAVEQVKTNTINEIVSAKETVEKVRAAIKSDKTIELAINGKVDAIIDANKDKLFKAVKNNIVSLPVTMFVLGVLVSGIASIVLSSIINKSENDYYVNLDYAVKTMISSPDVNAKANYEALKQLVNSRRLDK